MRAGAGGRAGSLPCEGITLYSTPLAIPFLGVTVRPYLVMMVLAVAVCHAVGPRWARALEGLETRQTRALLIIIGIPAIVGGRLHYVVNSWSLFAGRRLAMLAFWTGGMHIGGAMVLMALAVPLVCRWTGVKSAKLADALVPTLAVGLAITRLGCFLQGCCFGTPCAWPWCVTFPPSAYAYDHHMALHLIAAGAARSAAVHPLQLYFAGAALAIGAIAAGLRGMKRYDGEVALVGVLLFSVSSAVLELFRAETFPRAYWGPLPQLLWTALGMAAAAAAALVAAELTHWRRTRTAIATSIVATSP